MTAERVVLDTNVVFSAPCSRTEHLTQLSTRCVRPGTVLLFSDQTFVELRTRLLHSKFDRYVSRAGRLVLLAQLEAASEFRWIQATSGKGTAISCRLSPTCTLRNRV